MYAPSQQYGTAAPAPGVPSGHGGGGQYRASPVQVPNAQHAYVAQGYQQAMYQQQPQGQQVRQQVPQQQYPGGYMSPPVPAGMPMQMPVQMVPGQGQYSPQQQQQYYAQQQQQQQQQQAGGSRRQHKGTIPPGQMVRIGNNTVRIERYLSEGGYAHVYLTTSDKPIYPPKENGSSKGRWGEKGYTEHCLKRIAFNDENVWADVSKEIEVMKSLPRSPHLIQYLDSSHHRLPNGTHEVFILMEYCSGGGIIDLLNKRLRDRLKEIEILNIFTDVCEAVAAMHALSRPLLHRDLKIENVLSNPNGQAPTAGRPTPLIFKLCDFGSTTFPATHPPTTKAEADALAMDLNKHTTLQYRSPEMVEPMLGWPVGLPSDVWALGVLLYKLCYYTTPFEEHGTLAIVNAKYTFPAYPVYSPRLQHLIASMLVEHPTRRPSVFDVLRVAHEMSGTAPLVDYPPSNRPLPATIPTSPVKKHRTQPSNNNVLDFTDSSSHTPPPEPSLASTVTPQRRGRPPKVQPPPPQLPATATVTPTPVPIRPGQSEPGRQPHVPSASLPAAKTNRLQVTGESPTRSSTQPPAPTPPAPGHKPSPSLSSKASAGKLQTTGPSHVHKPTPTSRQSSVDAFGAPKNDASVVSPTGSFGDAFGVTLKSTKSPPVSGFGDSFTGSKFSRPPPPTLPGGFSDSFSGNTVPRGFSDSFNGKLGDTAPKPPPKDATPTSPKKEIKVSPSSTSSRKSPDPSSSIPDGELSFEQRFPSLEAMQASSPKSATKSDSPKTSPTVAPKTVSSAPKAMRRPSLVIANHTGGDLAPSLRSPKVPMQQLPPQPRSTQVTGTAFKSSGPTIRAQSPNDMSSPANPIPSDSATADYLSLLDDENVPAAGIVDLMGDEESESMRVALAPLRPVLSKSPSSGSRFGINPGAQHASQQQESQPQKPPPAQKSGAQTQKPRVARKPEALALKPDSTLAKPQGAAQRATLPPMSAERPTTNFNSAQWSPLQRMRTESSTKSTSPTVPVSPIRGTKDLLDDSSDDEAHPENANGSGLRPISPARRAPPSPSIARRMSWFEPGTSSPTSLASPIQPSVRHGSISPGSRPQSMFIASSPRSHSPAEEGSHSRRGSINDIVTRYERMSTKPVVAAKPSNLTGSHTGGVTTTSQNRLAPNIPNKPQMLRKPSGGRPMPAPTGGRPMPGGGLRRASTINTQSRPPTQPKPAGLQTSSQSKTNVPPVPALPANPSGPQAPASAVQHSASGSTSRSSSPEKQQPVNILIARWNKGQV